MKNSIKNLNKEELISLKNDIERELKTIEVNENKINFTSSKNLLTSLKQGDKILGIRLSFGGHTLKEPDTLNGEVDIIDYCEVESIYFDHKNEKIRLSISNSEHPMGIYNLTLNKDQYDGEYCYLNIDLFKSGYDSFYTLKPKSWKKDLKRLQDNLINRLKKSHDQDYKLYDDKIKLFLEGEDKVNNFFKENNII